MKKLFIFTLAFFMFIPNVKAEELLENAKSGILIEVSSGEILYEKNKDEQVSIASLTKMMVQTLVLEKIEEGSIKWTDIVTTSSNASGMGGTQIWLSTGEKMSVEDLFKGMSVVSANDATVALCEYIAGSEKECVKLMNDKVKSLGLKNTEFKNCTGLDEKGHYSSAYDLAIIAKNLLSHDEILRFSSIYEDYIRKDTPNKYWIVNTNKLVRFYEGADGLKTGFTDNALYTMAVTAKRDNMRLIANVLGEKEGKVIIQTFNPEHYAILYSKNHDYKSFYRNEMSIRHKLGYPPYYYLTVVRVSSKDYNEAKDISEKVGNYLKKNQKYFII